MKSNQLVGKSGKEQRCEPQAHIKSPGHSHLLSGVGLRDIAALFNLFLNHKKGIRTKAFPNLCWMRGLGGRSRLPMWERGLKPEIYAATKILSGRLPMWERGLKAPQLRYNARAISRRLPMWERGLKGDV